MSFWNVTGADEESGTERTVRIYAASKEEAEARGREQGLLISSILPAGDKPATSRGAPQPSFPRAKLKELPADGIPTYQGLEAARLMFYWLAWLTVAGMAIAIVAIIVYIIRNPDAEGVETFRTGCEAIFSLSLLIVCEFAASAGCAALRDIARNSWIMARAASGKP